MFSIVTIFIVGIFVGLVACQTPPSSTPTSAEATAAPQQGQSASSLSWLSAQKRARQISDVTYKLNLKIPADQPNYSGDVSIHFHYTTSADPLRVDFREGTVLNLTVNDAEVKAVNNGSFLLINPENLKQGMNEIKIQFEQKYSKSGEGLHRFADPEDQLIYLWTQFEPFDANLFFPCFDQPDLKASYSMQVTAPSSWKLISTMSPSSVKDVDSNWKLWSFPNSPRISTYLFSLFAGPYTEWKDHAGNIPLRLFARKSLAKYVNSGEWFELTKLGLQFYQNYFDYPYPFVKYDQVIVPEATFGAMENPGAVAFAEGYVSRGKKTEKEKQNLADTLLHEMAHMWFGDLVTMEWWNDLWLNESFATYMAALAMDRATSFKTTWLDFYSSSKSWAYYEDQLITTHPIEAPIQNTDDTRSVFDGITYGKGAAVFKQLHHFIGEEKFREGLQLHFKTYAFKNATLKNFMGSLAKAAGQDLSAWSASWLKEAGVDELTYSFTCEQNQLKDISLAVRPQKSENPRPHAFDIALLQDKAGKLQVFHTLAVKTPADGIARITSTEKLSCPKAVFANYQDHAYLKVNIDEKSLKALSNNLSKIADPFIRLMTWDSLWQMVRDQKIPLADYVQLVRKHYPKETHSEIIFRVGNSISGGRHSEQNSIFYFWPQTNETQKSERSRFIIEMENLYWKKAQKSAKGSDLQKIWFDHFANAARSAEALQRTSELLIGKNLVPGLKLDMDRKWKMLTHLCQYDFPSKSELLFKLSKDDSSERGLRGKLACEVLEPKAENKEKWYKEIKDEKSLYSHAMQREIMKNLVPYEQINFQSLYREDFYSFLRTESTKRDDSFTARFTDYLAPMGCTQDSATRLRSFAEQEPSLHSAVKTELLKASDEDARCALIRRKALTN